MSFKDCTQYLDAKISHKKISSLPKLWKDLQKLLINCHMAKYCIQLSAGAD